MNPVAREIWKAGDGFEARDIVGGEAECVVVGVSARVDELRFVLSRNALLLHIICISRMRRVR